MQQNVHNVRTIVFSWSVICLCSPAVWSSEEDVYHGPEYYEARHQTDDFIPEARHYFETHADYEIAPRVALDLYMAAVVRQDAALTEWAMARLVFDYPDSLPTRFLLTTIPQPASFGTFLTGQFKRSVNEPRAKFIRKFTGAIDLGVLRFGPQFVTGDDLLICASLASLEARLFGLGMLCLRNSREANFEVRQIVNTLLNERLDAGERFVRMQRFSDREIVRTGQRILFGMLSSEEQSLPEVRRAAAENLLREMKFAEAMPMIVQLAQENADPQLAFWKGWCLASLGREQEAVQVLEAIVRDHAGNEWSKPAASLRNSITGSKETAGAYATVLQRLVTQARADALEAIELKMSYTPQRGAPVELYFWQDALRQEMEVVCRKAAQPVLAYQSVNNTNRIHFAGEPQIHHFDQAGGMLASQLSVEQRQDGELRWNFSWQLVGRALEGTGLYRWFDSPLLNSEAGLRDLIQSLCGRGTFPVAIEVKDSVRTLRWISPVADRAELQEFVLTIGADDRLVGARFDRLVCDVLRHGPSGSFQRTTPQWPKLETTLHARTDGSVMFRFMSAVMSLMNDPTEVTSVAEREESAGVSRN